MNNIIKCRVSDSLTRQDAREMLGLRYRYAKQQNSWVLTPLQSFVGVVGLRYRSTHPTHCTAIDMNAGNALLATLVKSYSGLQTFVMESKLTSFVAWRSDSLSQAFIAHPVGLSYR